MRDVNRILCSFLVAVAIASPLIAGDLPEISIDCDNGENLQKALDELGRKGGGRVLVSGTCIVSARVVTPGIIQIIGESPKTTTIQSGPSAAVYAFGEGYLEIRDLKLAGGDGVWATGPNRSVVVSGCEIEADWNGIHAESGAGVSVQDSEVSGQFNAVSAWYSSVWVEDSRLHDSTFAARIFDAKLVLNRTEVIDNEIGIFAEDGSEVSVYESRFAGNGQGHVGLNRDSRLTLVNTAIGESGDPTNLSFYVDRSSSVEVYYDDLTSEIWGPATILNDSYISIDGTALHGSIALRSFSRLMLDGRVLDGVIDCQSAADAVCGPGASAFSVGCASIAADSCVPDLDAETGGIGLPMVPELPGPKEFVLPMPGGSIEKVPGSRGARTTPTRRR